MASNVLLAFASNYFLREASDWSVDSFTNEAIRSRLKGDLVGDQWKKTLQFIATNYDETPVRQSRARDLLVAFDQPGGGTGSKIAMRQTVAELAKKGTKVKNLQSREYTRIRAAPRSAATVDHIFDPPAYSDHDNLPPDLDAISNPDPEDQPGVVDKHIVTDEPETEPETKLRPGTAKMRSEYASLYSSMSKNRKWVLSNGRCVEDILHLNVLALNDSSFKHSLAVGGVIDISSPEMRSWFSSTEWSEILATITELPKVDDLLSAFMMRNIWVKSAAELEWNLRYCPYIPAGVVYSEDHHFDARWADTNLRNFVQNYSISRPMPLSRHKSTWYDTCYWPPLIDGCMSSLKDVDSLHSTPSMHYEYAGMEFARTFTGASDARIWLGDSPKVARGLRDMMQRVQDKNRFDQLYRHCFRLWGSCTLAWKCRSCDYFIRRDMSAC